MNRWTQRLSALCAGGKGMRLVVVLGIAGLAMILLSSLLPSDKKTPQAPAQTAVSTDATAYADALTDELTRVLSSLRGVGRAEVLVTLAGSEAQVYAAEQSTEQDEHGARAEIRYVVVGSGGNQTALVESVTNPQVSGVVIVCEGGDNSVVREQVVRAATVACGVPSTRVFVGALH